MDEQNRRATLGGALSGPGPARPPGLSAPAGQAPLSAGPSAGIGTPSGASAGLRASAMAPPATPAVPKAPPPSMPSGTSIPKAAGVLPGASAGVRAPRTPGVIERAAAGSGYGVVGQAWGGDPDAIGGGGARPVYGMTLPGPGDQAGAPAPDRTRAPADLGRSGYGVVGMAYGGDPDAIGGGGPRPVYGWSIGAPADSSHAPGQGEVSTPGSGSIENLRPSPGASPQSQADLSPAGVGIAGMLQPAGPIGRAAQRMGGASAGGAQPGAPGEFTAAQILEGLPSPAEFMRQQDLSLALSSFDGSEQMRRQEEDRRQEEREQLLEAERDRRSRQSRYEAGLLARRKSEASKRQQDLVALMLGM